MGNMLNPDHLLCLQAHHPAWGSMWTHSANLHFNFFESDQSACSHTLIHSTCVCGVYVFLCEARRTCVAPCVLVFVCVSQAPEGVRRWDWKGLSVWWCDSTGAEQGQAVQLHLWPFCFCTTWPLTVFRCYMTRRPEPGALGLLALQTQFT